MLTLNEFWQTEKNHANKRNNNTTTVKQDVCYCSLICSLEIS